jgi:hypothetical protein
LAKNSFADATCTTQTLDRLISGVWLNGDIEDFLNVGLGHIMQPEKLLLACPPFVFQESRAGSSLKAAQTEEVLLFYADLARRIRDIADGGKVRLKVI